MSKFAHETTEAEESSLSKEEIFEILQKYSYIQDSTEVIAPKELRANRELWNRADKFGATSEAFFSAQMQERAQNICTTLNAINAYLVKKKVGKEVLRLLRDGEDGLLRSHLLSERNLREDDLILFMREFIGYVAMLSDFPEEKRNHALAIFPPIQKSEYACIEGTRDRLQEAVKFLRKVEMTPRERMIFDVHNEIVEEARIKFSPFVYEGNQPHLIPAINYLFGFDDTTKSQAKHTALEIPAEKAWQAILGYRQAFQ